MSLTVDGVKELSRICKRDGLLRPRTVVDEARDEDNVLHTHFEWDDSKAADGYRTDQARALIRSVKITTSKEAEETVTVAAYVHVPGPEDEAGYTLVTRVKRTDAASVMADELKRNLGNVLRASQIAETLSKDLSSGFALELTRIYVRLERLYRSLDIDDA